MDKPSKQTDNVGSFYKQVWPEYVRWWHADETQGLHYAYYDQNTTNFKEAILRMNDYAGFLLNLHNHHNGSNVLDAGCGVGGTILHLAKNHPNIKFSGITICPDQVTLAKQYCKKNAISNVDFYLQNYLSTEFPSNYFDSILALESTNHTDKPIEFLEEMNRILKPGGRMVIIDLFQNAHIRMNPVMDHLYQSVCKDRGYAHPLILNEFIQNLKNHDFKIEAIENITKNVIKSQTRSFIIGIPFYFSTILKRHILVRLKLIDDFIDHSFGTAVPMSIFGLYGIGSYNAIISIKK